MTDPQLELVMLTVTPEEARMIATSLSVRAINLGYAEIVAGENSGLVKKYNDLRRKVEYQSGASDKP
jgi:ethanolamine utilization microcompartment shell protein EutS